MARSDSDTWDLASSVGATATMVAAARTLASTEPGAIIDDPFAAPLVRAVGIDFFTRLVDGELQIPGDGEAGAGVALMTDVMAVRTRFFDDFFLDAGRAGVRQAVILASGLDARPYRLPWPDGTVVYEIDQPEVIEFKSATMAALGAQPTAQRRTVPIDLRQDWPTALREHGLDTARPVAWSAEGLLMYLPPEAQDRLFDDITALSAPGSMLATEFHGGELSRTLSQRAQEMVGQWGDHGFDIDLGELFYDGDRSHVVDYLSERGWTVSTRTRPEVFAQYGRTYPQDATVEQLRNSLAVTAVKQ
ncbi:class I SAM-dependent methyltransferase [Mycolicibacterium palauense]|uniref:class I SAM-dependent methyltransferase n=1 Tax=Mycolicibacterium palauense TaxID=2034511 RepID=UPI000BFED2C6|nr:class I SAM-dependent methyltransferase [Mycolicibacterium palauense]